MKNSLERLLKLAAKTGDTVIVHDVDLGRDLVILDLDKYEELVEVISSQDSEYPFVEMSPPQPESVDSINRELALTREDKKMNFVEDPQPELAEVSIDEISPSVDTREQIIPITDQFELSEEGNHLDNQKGIGIASSWASTRSILERRLNKGENEDKTSIPRGLNGGTTIDLSQEENISEDDEEPIFYEEPV